MQIKHLNEVINLLCYGGAIVGSVVAGYLLWLAPLGRNLSIVQVSISFFLSTPSPPRPPTTASIVADWDKSREPGLGSFFHLSVGESPKIRLICNLTKEIRDSRSRHPRRGISGGEASEVLGGLLDEMGQGVVVEPALGVGVAFPAVARWPAR